MGFTKSRLVFVGKNLRVVVKMVLKCFVFVLCTLCCSTVQARPQAPYNYPAPSLRAVPATPSQSLGLSTSQNFGQTQSQAQNFNIPSTSYGTPISRNTNSGISATSSSSSGGPQQGYTREAQPSRSYGTPEFQSSQPTPSNRYIPQAQQEQISIQKHIYVHVAPPEEEPRQQRVQQQEVSRQKHYKIIFIKAPTYNPPAAYIAQQQALQEEKTLVYVLVKKPEEAAEIQAPQVAPAKINKPEVYFIKYKSRKEENGGQNVQQPFEPQEDNEAVVIESAAGRGASGSASAYDQGYNYDRPAGTLN